MDGYIAVVANTIVLTDKVVDGKFGDAFACAAECIEFASKAIHAGNKNSDITKGFEKIAKSYEVSLAEGVLSHQHKRFVIDGAKSILLKSMPDQHLSEFEFEDFSVFSVDVFVTTGKGNFRFVFLFF
jgi:methionine aminopeptidase